MCQRNKRLFDFLSAFLLLLLWPLTFLFVQEKVGYFKNIFSVLFGRKTWVGYAETQEKNTNLPPLKASVLTPLDGLSLTNTDTETTRRLNFLYAKDYTTAHDFEIFRKGFNQLGRE